MTPATQLAQETPEQPASAKNEENSIKAGHSQYLSCPDTSALAQKIGRRSPV